MLTSTDALLRAILETPQADDLRLIYADAIEDEGEWVRAGNIRWFVAHPKYEQGAPIQHAAKDWPEADRFNAHTCCVICRGFVSEVRMPMAAFTEEMVRDLFSAHPITTVVLTDREPKELPVDGWGWYVRFHDSWVIAADDLPPRFRDFIGGKLRYDNSNWRHFPDRQSALLALSAACVAYGRGLVGLPPLALTGPPRLA